MAERDVTHQLAAIFYADVCGYSRLTEADELVAAEVSAAELEQLAEEFGG